MSIFHPKNIDNEICRTQEHCEEATGTGKLLPWVCHGNKEVSGHEPGEDELLSSLLGCGFGRRALCVVRQRVISPGWWLLHTTGSRKGGMNE